MQSLNGTCELSLVCPAYNEQENLPMLLEEWNRALESCGTSFEMIVVDDGSTDSSSEVLRLALKSYPALRVLRMARRSGQSAALAAGCQAGRGYWIVTSDADLQNDPGDLPKLLELRDHFDMVCGWRRERQDRWTKRLISRVANASRRRVLDDGVHDTGCGLKLFRREVIERILKFDGMHRFLPSLAKMEGFRVVEVPVRHRARLHGKSKYWIFNRFRRPVQDLRGVAWYRARRLSHSAVEVTRLGTPRLWVCSAAARSQECADVQQPSDDRTQADAA